MSSAGRPLTPIDWDVVGEWLMKGCSGVQVAAVIGVHHETLYDRCVAEHGVYFSEYSVKFRSKGDALLHGAQFDNALKGNTTLLVHLGKHRLGQDEKDAQDKKQSELQQILDESPSDSKELVNERKDTQPILASQPPLQDC